MSDELMRTWLNSEFRRDGLAYSMPIRVVRDDPWFITIDIGHDDKPDSAIARVGIHLGSDGRVVVYGERAADIRTQDSMDEVFEAEILPIPPQDPAP